MGRPLMRPLGVEPEQPAEALTPLNVGVRAYRKWRLLQKLVVESLVVSLRRLGGLNDRLDILGASAPYLISGNSVTFT